jgi:hypothetical protein
MPRKRKFEQDVITVAGYFIEELELTEVERQEVLKRNAEYNDEGYGSVCATHDIMDSNMQMSYAIARFLGIDRSIVDACGDDYDDEWDKEAEDRDLFNRAWDCTKYANYSMKELRELEVKK